MSDDKTYNGWKGGYETWAVARWLDYERMAELSQDFVDNYGSLEEAKEESVVLADQIEELMEEFFGEVTITGPYADLLQHALGCVDWREIAEYYISDCTKAQADPVHDDAANRADDQRMAEEGK